MSTRSPEENPPEPRTFHDLEECSSEYEETGESPQAVRAVLSNSKKTEENDYRSFTAAVR